ncbi:MAG TPA: 5-formyltetrahydrofolate cyclo-ligase [Woeseiaceae bacterium]|nr:5-formyltetrahydrofolate cyclo-ligase [Woeseiaceae bacterium]
MQLRKKALRRKGREARRSLGTDERRNASARIAATVVHSHFFRRSRRIACYLPMPEEVDTWPIIERAWRMKKRIFAPITGRHRLLRFREVRPETTLVTTDFGLQEPLSGEELTARELDLVITPLVAFDDAWMRIGMAGGYYDRTFSFLRARSSLLRPKLVGVAFACQEVEKVPLNPWDIGLYRVITECS